MNRLKPTSLAKPQPVQTSSGAELPTEPGIWSKLLPDGRVVPWIILPNSEPTTDFAPHHAARGCYKCTN